MSSALDRHLAVFRPIRHRVPSTRKKSLSILSIFMDFTSFNKCIVADNK